jgi:hypothetical protein
MVLFIDGSAMVVSYGEQIFVDGVASILLIGCAGGPATCAESLALIVQTDLLVTTLASPVENTAGVTSFAATAISDLLQGNTNSSPPTIGVDTIVSGRNMLLGFIPEANIDAWTSASQFGYDLDRFNGVEPGGSIPISDWQDIVTQTFWRNTFWQSAWDYLFHTFSR